MPHGPTIGIVVLHYGADELTLRCLRALLADDRSPDAEIVLVDNGPGADFAALVRRELRGIKVIEPSRNLGFAAGCNLGISALVGHEMVALVNSDIEVAPGWLTPLVDALEADATLGAASPKIRFDGGFHTLVVKASTSWVPGRGDDRSLAWRFEGARVGQEDVTGSCRLVEGFWEPEPEGVWAGPRAVLRVPAVGGGTTVELTVGGPPGGIGSVTIDADGSAVHAEGVGRWSVPLHGAPCPVINNVGNAWRPDGYGIDLGFDELDEGQYDRPRHIDAWCGGAVLLRRTYLDATGGFDDRLFLYYEDLDLSLRGAAQGWRYWYEPRSVVAHRHGASSEAQPRWVQTLKERNRLLLLVRHGSPRQVARELARFVAITGSYLRREVLAPVARREAPRWGAVRVRVAAAVGALRLAPGMVVSRRRAQRSRPGMPPLA